MTQHSFKLLSCDKNSFYDITYFKHKDKWLQGKKNLMFEVRASSV